MTLRYICLLFLSLLVPGCVYPVYKTLQPSSVVTVQDVTGAPVENASVTVISNAYPYGEMYGRDTQITNALGQAVFNRRSEWRTEVAAIHGWEQFSWNVCVEKPGYQMYFGPEQWDASSMSAATVILKTGVSSPCPLTRVIEPAAPAEPVPEYKSGS